jgi:hypothetical protein
MFLLWSQYSNTNLAFFQQIGGHSKLFLLHTKIQIIFFAVSFKKRQGFAPLPSLEKKPQRF